MLLCIYCTSMHRYKDIGILILYITSKCTLHCITVIVFACPINYIAVYHYVTIRRYEPVDA